MRFSHRSRILGRNFPGQNGKVAACWHHQRQAGYGDADLWAGLCVFSILLWSHRRCASVCGAGWAWGSESRWKGAPRSKDLGECLLGGSLRASWFPPIAFGFAGQGDGSRRRRCCGHLSAVRQSCVCSAATLWRCGSHCWISSLCCSGFHMDEQNWPLSQLQRAVCLLLYLLSAYGASCWRHEAVRQAGYLSELRTCLESQSCSPHRGLQGLCSRSSCLQHFLPLHAWRCLPCFNGTCAVSWQLCLLVICSDWHRCSHFPSRIRWSSSRPARSSICQVKPPAASWNPLMPLILLGSFGLPYRLVSASSSQPSWERQDLIGAVAQLQVPSLLAFLKSCWPLWALLEVHQPLASQTLASTELL